MQQIFQSLHENSTKDQIEAENIWEKKTSDIRISILHLLKYGLD